MVQKTSLIRAKRLTSERLLTYTTEMSTNLQRLESDDPHVGGALVTFDNGTRKTIRWQAKTPIVPTLDAAKQYTTAIVQQLLEENREIAIRNTNWASVTAAMQRIISDYNDKLRAKLYAST